LASKQEFIDTEIGRIPREWRVVKLGSISVNCDNERIPIKVTKRKNIQGKYPYYGASGIIDYVCDYIYDGRYLLISEDGANLLSRSTPIAFIAEGKFWVNNHAHVISMRNGVFMDYISYYINITDLKEWITGTAQPKLTKSNLEAIPIPLPPLPEQRKIAEVLSTVDDALEKVGQSIEKTQRLKSGLMHHLFTRGIGHKEFKDTEIGRIPREWKSVTLEDFASKKKNAIVDGPFGSNLKTEHYCSSGIPVIQSGYVTSNKFIAESYFFVELTKFEKEIRSKVEPGDIVMAKIGANCGKCAILPDGHPVGILAGNSLKISIDENKSKVFLMYLLHYYFSMNKLDSVTSKTAQPAINLSALKKLLVIFPPLPEQKKIAEILSTVDKRIELLQAKREALTRVKQGLMNDLLTGKMRVKVA
jgi:type I restriction enzyme S subunit